MINFHESEATDYQFVNGLIDWNAPKVPRPTFAGVTLRTIVRTERVMSDVWDDLNYAQIWDGSKVREIWYTPGKSTVVVDATPDVVAAANAYLVSVEVARLQREREDRINRAKSETREFRRGRRVIVVAGRKLAKGETGEIFWYGENRYGFAVGLTLDSTGERVFTAPRNVEVVNPESYYVAPDVRTDAEIVEIATRTVMTDRYATPFVVGDTRTLRAPSRN